MSHARQQIRDAVATAVTGLSITGANVSKTRMFRFENDECPALSVYTLSEEIERDTMKPSRLRRILRVAVQIAVKQTDAIDAEIDDIAVEVETALEAAHAGGAGVWSQILDFALDSATITMSGDGDTRALGMVLAYTAVYRTVEGAPETIID